MSLGSFELSHHARDHIYILRRVYAEQKLPWSLTRVYIQRERFKLYFAPHSFIAAATLESGACLCEREKERKRIWPLYFLRSALLHSFSASFAHSVGVRGIFYFAAGFFSRAFLVSKTREIGRECWLAACCTCVRPYCAV